MTLPMPWPELAALLLFATAMAFTPGPNTTLAAALAANRGLGHAMRFVCAVPVGWGLLLVGVTLGLGALLATAPVLRGALQALGLGYMLWLAWKLARSGALGQADPARFDVGFGQGVLLQFVNIKAWMLALTLSAGWVVSSAGAPAANPGERLAIVCVVMVLFAFSSNFAYALIGSLLRDWLARGRRLLWFNRVLAGVLVATALWMLTV